MASNDQPSPERKATYSGSQDSRFIGEIRSNVKSDLIEITADKLENILLKHTAKLTARRSWATPLPVFLTALLASLTATFTNKFGIEGAIWHALFLVLGSGALVWLIVNLVKLCAYWRTSSLDYLICEIKDTQKNTQQKDISTSRRSLFAVSKNGAPDVPIKAGLSMWLDASDISSLFQTSDGKKPVIAEHDPVGLWADKSGNCNNFLQFHQGARPFFIQKGIGSKSSVMFNTGQSLYITKNFQAPVTVIYVAKQTGGASRRVLSGMSNNWLLGYWNGAKDQAYYEGWVSPKGSPATDDLPHVFLGIVRGNGQNSEICVDGSPVAENKHGITGPNGLAINTGSAPKEASDCQVGEIIVFDREISHTEKHEIEEYLKIKWKIH